MDVESTLKCYLLYSSITLVPIIYIRERSKVEKIQYEPFMALCKTKLNQELETISNHAKFKLTSVQSDRLEWIVLYQNHRHYSTQKGIQKYIDYFNQTNSFCSAAYYRNMHGTDALYMLPLFKLYIG